MTAKKNSKPWVKDLLVAFAGTTLSIILTFGTSSLIDRINRNKDRKLTAMMVLSSIESSVRSLEESATIMARKDTVAQWLLSIPLSDVKALPEDALMPAITEVMMNYAISTDKTVESIFSSNTDIWKNIGNFQFIDNVGKCYSSIRVIEADWKEQMLNISIDYAQILENPERYPGKTLQEKVLSNKNVRAKLAGIRSNREWLKYICFALRESNRKNMEMIGITEEEVIAFTDKQSSGLDSEHDVANEAYFKGEFSFPILNPDSLSTVADYARLLDSLRSQRH